MILDAPRGAGGFGYDPLFYDPELDRTFAEIDRDEKNARSHRGRAFRALADALMERTMSSTGPPPRTAGDRPHGGRHPPGHHMGGRRALRVPAPLPAAPLSRAPAASTR